MSTPNETGRGGSLWVFDEVSLDVTAPSGKVICQVEDQGGPDCAHQKYGKLIAAAPELLAALREAREYLVSEMEFKQLPETSVLGQIALQCEAAIQLATE